MRDLRKTAQKTATSNNVKSLDEFFDDMKKRTNNMEDENRQLIWTLTGISLALSVVQWYIGRKIAQLRGK